MYPTTLWVKKNKCPHSHISIWSIKSIHSHPDFTICTRLTNVLLWWKYIQTMWKIHLQKQLCPFWFLFFWIVHSREYQSTECWVVLIPQIHFFLRVQLQEYQLNWCWFNHFKNGFYLFLHMKSSGSGQLSHPYSPLAGSSLSAVGMEVKGCEGQRRGHTQAPGTPGVRHRTDQRRPWLLLESMVGSRERRSWTDGAQHSVFCWRGEAGRRESILSLLSWLIKSLSNAVPSLTNALIPMTHTNVCLPLLSVPFGGVSMLLACLLPARAARL